jgi:predicted protein tyrosine phosphatase
MNLLFVCTENRLRSPTAEALFDGYPGVRARSAGIGSQAPVRVTRELIDWAHVVVVMEAVHREHIQREHCDALHDTPLVCLDIPDRFPFMDAELVELLERRVPEHVTLPAR